MKRCIFAGPSLHGVVNRPRQIDFLPPASCGDLVAQVQRGMKWIGLIDGYFGSCASVWHKEILYALSKGCHVWGAASMGALRAAECMQFGMRPVGSIAWQYASGQLDDDAEVALVHGPEEADYVPFTEALVDARATIAAMSAAAAVSNYEADRLLAAAVSLHFGERTVETIAAKAMDGSSRRAEIALSYETYRVRAKRADALQLVAEMCLEPPVDRVETSPWVLARSPSLSALGIDCTLAYASSS